MTPPTRLREDPGTLREAGVDLGNEELAHHDLNALQARLEAAVSSIPWGVHPRLDGVSRAAAWKAWTGYALAFSVGVVCHAAYVTVRSPPPPLDATVATPPPQEPAAPPAPVTSAQAPTPAAEPRERPSPQPGAPRPASRPAAGPASTLADQLRLYESARSARRAGSSDIAMREAALYLERFPQGDLRFEIAAILLEALWDKQDWARMESTTSALLMGECGRHDKARLLNWRAQARARMNQCDKARTDHAAALVLEPVGDAITQERMGACLP